MNVLLIYYMNYYMNICNIALEKPQITISFYTNKCSRSGYNKVCNDIELFLD